jgi:hypothetical protein
MNTSKTPETATMTSMDGQDITLGNAFEQTKGKVPPETGLSLC